MHDSRPNDRIARQIDEYVETHPDASPAAVLGALDLAPEEHRDLVVEALPGEPTVTDGGATTASSGEPDETTEAPDEYADVPEALRRRPQWLLWDASNDAPRRPAGWRNGRLDWGASWTDPGDWLTFDEAVQAASESESVGIGFVVAESDPFTAIDLDGGLVDRPNGDLAPKDWVPSLAPFNGAAYQEVSPSRTGAHVVFTGGEVPEWWANQHFSADEHEGVEAYDKKFITVTGDVLPTSAEEPGEVEQTDLDAWLADAYEEITGDDPLRAARDTASESLSAAASEHSGGEVDVGVYDLLSRSSHPEGEQTEHPVHGSSSGRNFEVDEGGETFRCWRHETTGNALHLLGMEEGLIECGEWTNGLDAETWRDIFDAARERGLDVGEAPTSTPTTDTSEPETTDAPLAEAILDAPGEWIDAETQTLSVRGTADHSADEVAEMFRTGDLPDAVRADLALDLDGEHAEAFRAWNAEPEEWSVVTARERGPWYRVVGKYLDDVTPVGYANHAAKETLADEFDLLTESETDRMYLYNPDRGVFRPGAEPMLCERLETKLGAENKRSRAENILFKLRSSTYVDTEELGGPDEMFCVGNGVLELSDPDAPTLVEHSPEYRFTAGSPVEYDPGAECPRWREFVDDVVRDEDVEKLQEFIGYTLMHWTQREKAALLLLGPTNSGKSTFLNVVQELLGGRDNVAAESLQDLTDSRWGKAQLFGKLANIFNDLNARAVENESTFKTLTGDEAAVSAERKNENKFEFRPTQKLMFSANRVPDVPNADEAFHDRWLHVSFPDTVPKTRRDPDLETALKQELPGILNWALEGMARLCSNGGGFTGERSEWEKRAYWESYGNSAERFKSECLNASGSSAKFVPKDDVYAAYTAFCKAEGLNAETKNMLTRELTSDGRIEKGRRTPKDEQGRATRGQIPCYVGVTLDEDAVPDLSEHTDEGGDGVDRGDGTATDGGTVCVSSLSARDGSPGRHRCAMCGEGMREPADRIRLPPALVEALRGGERVDPDDLVGDVTVYLCDRHAEEYRTLVEQLHSPLRECDVEHASMTRREHAVGTLAGGASGDARRDREKLLDALATVETARTGDGEHLLPSEVYEAKAIVLGARDLGLL